MFPELRDRLKSLLPGFDTGPISLDLKAQVGPDFTPASAAFYAKAYPQIYSILSGGGPAWSGETVSRETALQHPVVWACNGIVAGTIGFLPANLMRAVKGEKQEATEHPFYNALKHAPNDEITAQCFREMLTSHCLLQGNGYAQIIRRSGTGVALGLEPLIPESVLPDREKTGQRRLVYILKQSNGPDKTFTVERGKPHDILHLRGLGWDGLRGYSVIQIGRQSIGTAIAEEHYAARFWAMGGRLPYLLKKARSFQTDEQFEKWRNNWERVYSDYHKAPVLENGDDYQQIGSSMKDAQAVETRQATISEIARWFLVSPHLVGDLSRATFSNIEHLALEFVKMTLAGWLSRWEQEFWRCVLTPEEKAQGYFLRHNLNALLRGDFVTRMAGYASALQNGHLNVDEVRDLEDRNPLPDGAGQDYHIQLNMQALPADGNQQQAASLIRLGKNPDRASELD